MYGIMPEVFKIWEVKWNNLLHSMDMFNIYFYQIGYSRDNYKNMSFDYAI